MANKTITISINGSPYVAADLSETARTLVGNIQVTDQKIAQLKQDIALFEVARETFGRALLAHLPAAAAETAQ